MTFTLPYIKKLGPSLFLLTSQCLWVAYTVFSKDSWNLKAIQSTVKVSGFTKCPHKIALQLEHHNRKPSFPETQVALWVHEEHACLASWLQMADFVYQGFFLLLLFLLHDLGDYWWVDCSTLLCGGYRFYHINVTVFSSWMKMTKGNQGHHSFPSRTFWNNSVTLIAHSFFLSKY